MCIALGTISMSIGQNLNKTQNSQKVKKEMSALVNEVSKKIEMSNYQQKSTVNVLIKVAEEYFKIESSTQSASDKTIARGNLEKKKEYSLRSILNTQQYEMLIAQMKNE